jgi:hypothetical protein
MLQVRVRIGRISCGRMATSGKHEGEERVSTWGCRSHCFLLPLCTRWETCLSFELDDVIGLSGSGFGRGVAHQVEV